MPDTWILVEKWVKLEILVLILLRKSGENRYLVQNTRIRSYIGHENKIFKNFLEKVCILCIFWWNV